MTATSQTGGAGQRRTRQRQVILEELRKLKSHPRSDELYVLVRQRLPKVSLGTVYRNLDRLQSEGLALEIYCGDFVRYDADVSVHDHFMCRICRRVWDFDARGPRPPEDPGAAGFAGFKVESQFTMYSGLCPECGGSTADGAPT